MIVVRRIRPDDGPLLREIRLAAIADSASASNSTLAQAEAHDAVHWAQGAEAYASGATLATYFAGLDGEVVGMLGAYMMTGGVVTLVGLWSAPGHRDVGVADALLDAVLDWAASSGGRQLRVWLIERDEHARLFYERRGFSATGETMPHELDPAIRELEMTLAIEEQG
jgi:GNAT superfamily N-acetyltransferase